MNTTTNFLLTDAPIAKTVESSLLECMSNVVTLSDNDIQFIIDMIAVKTFKKGTVLLQEGEMSHQCYYNFGGCVRQYYLKDGEEKTTFFYTEEDSISTSTYESDKIPSKFYLECIEDTTLAVMTDEKERELYKRFPIFESLCRVDLERRLGSYQEMLAAYIISSPEERYLNLIKNRPELIYRVPQYQLASYLGVKPESLSRIRKRIAQKK